MYKKDAFSLSSFFCGSQGIGVPVDLCGAGWYCSGGATAAQPSVSAQGGQCEAGYFCPEGSSAMLACSPGTFCQDVGEHGKRYRGLIQRDGGYQYF